MTRFLKRSIIGSFFLALALLFVSCTGKTDTKDDGDKIYNSITKSCKLYNSFEGKDFISDGIGEASLIDVTDGDTASFKLTSGTTVRIRFYGIDTPESTGGVEKWGKSASKFTDKMLKSANKWVLEASTTPASVDSYGERYLGYIWYFDEKLNQYMNVNLQIVENGYSKNNCVNNPSYIYYSYFKDAEDFAKNKPLHLWDSNAEDPNFDNTAKEVTLKDLNENIGDYYNSEKDTGSKVRFTAALKSVSGSNTYTFKAASVIDGKEYTFNVYAGYQSSGIPDYLKVGNEYMMTGFIQKYSGSYQISGLTYVPLEEGGDYITLTKQAKYVTFNSSISNNGYYTKKTLFKELKITEAKIENGYVLYTGNAVSVNDSTLTSTFTIKALNTNNLTDVSGNVGKTIKTAGYQNETGIIEVLNYSDIIIK